MNHLNVSEYLEPLSTEAPCGDNLEYDPAFMALEIEVKGIPEQQIGDVVIPGEPPKWEQVEKNTLALLHRTRDLRLLVILAQAAVHTSGLSGLNQCLTLITSFLEQQWEKIHPQLDPDEDNDLTQRINILIGLCDFDKMIQPINKIPLVESRVFGQFSLRDVHIATGKLTVVEEEGGLPQLAEIEAAFKEIDLADLQSKTDIVADCVTQIDRIEAVIATQIGDANTPSFSPLRDVLQKIYHILTDHSAQRSSEILPEVVESIDSSYLHNRPLEIDVELASSTETKPESKSPATFGNRKANAWFVGTEPPLEIDRQVTVGFDIGYTREDAIVSAPFNEPDWHGHDRHYLWIALRSEDADIEPAGYQLVLPRTGNTQQIFFVVTPHNPECVKLRFLIYLYKEGVLLQELEATVPISVNMELTTS